MARVIVVDDDQEICKLIQDFLIHEGFEVSSYEDAHFAYADLEKTVGKNQTIVDLIITDGKMPKMDGLEFVKKLNQLGIKVPVIMISGFGVYHSLVQHNHLIEFLHKPFSLTELRGVINQVLKII